MTSEISFIHPVFLRKVCRLFVTAILIVSAQTQAYAASGGSSTGTRGGGDPDAASFCSSLLNGRLQLLRFERIQFTKTQIHKLVSMSSEICSKIDSPQTTPISFTDETIRDESGVEKVAYFTLSPLRIVVNRPHWKTLDFPERVSLATLELLGLSQIPNRYVIAGELEEILKRVKLIQLPFGTRITFREVVFEDGLFTYKDPTLRAPIEIENWFVTSLSASEREKSLLAAAVCRTFGQNDYESAGFSNLSEIKPIAHTSLRIDASGFDRISCVNGCKVLRLLKCKTRP